MPNKHQDPYRHKFARAKYKISNSREYDQSLKNRGSLIIWFSEEAVAKWNNPVSVHKKRGGQAIYSDSCNKAYIRYRIYEENHLFASSHNYSLYIMF
ncbi:MAG: transposase [Rickettsia endosymbiont of Culicoides impunctatus]|uniref:transposase n=1 Tax=unclassified Candidatus Tisiphia TaxID=2996318 RepID=UPI001E6ADF6D|nr:MAG: transposase [Rickettsia endosymbiont of Culicoides impunctatus]